MDIIDTLGKRVQPGELVLLGTSDYVGRIMQNGISAPYSHCAICVSKSSSGHNVQFIEVYPTGIGKRSLRIIHLDELRNRKIQTFERVQVPGVSEKVLERDFLWLVFKWELRSKQIRFSYWNTLMDAMWFWTEKDCFRSMKKGVRRSDHYWYLTCVTFAWLFYKELVGEQLGINDITVVKELPVTPSQVIDMLKGKPQE